MEKVQDFKKIVQDKYGQIALDEKQDNACCDTACCGSEVYNIMSDSYDEVEGYIKDADLGLGCGLPTQFARIKKDEVVVDLGSGAGNDAFIARHETGEMGRVVGIDFTPAMIDRARENNKVRGFTNVEFLEGDIEKMPLPDNFADVIVSNCVLNLVPDKASVFKEIFRVLKPGGHFSISDIVLNGQLPSGIQSAAEMYAGCVSGAIHKDSYLQMIRENGFSDMIIQKEKVIELPGDILSNYLDESEIAEFKNSGTGIFSITVYAEKPAKSCCGPECCN
ncbi:arsenite methyltransferase [soil metagenome]